MRSVRVSMRTPVDVETAFGVIAGLDARWRVPFRGRAICWTQRCEPSPDRRSIAFSQTEGHFRELRGAWRFVPAVDGCEVLFEADFELGVPIHSRVLDPLVAKVLTERVHTIVGNL